jgi:hypothetical protein
MLAGLVVKDKKSKRDRKDDSDEDKRSRKRHKEHKEKSHRSKHRDDSDDERSRKRDRKDDEYDERERQLAKAKLAEQLRSLQDAQYNPTPTLRTPTPAPQQPIAEEPTSTIKRDDWMTQAPKGGIFAGRLYDNKLEEEKKEEAPKPRELNPYFENGGTGMPAQVAEKPKTTVGDGGASWRARALQRAKERAIDEGKSVNDVVKEHWNVSRDEMEKSVEGVVIRPSKSHRRDSHRSKDYAMNMERPQMKRPDHSHDLKWSKKDDEKPLLKKPSSEREISFNRESSPPVQEKPVIASRMPAPTPERESIEPIDADAQEKMNRLAAKALKAQLMGDSDTFTALNNELETMKKSFGISSQPHKKETVAISDYDNQGKRIIKSDYERGSGADLRDLVLEAREGGIQGFDKQTAKSISKRSQYEEYIDDGHGMDMMSQDLLGGGKKQSKKRQKRSDDRKNAANKSAQIQEYKKQQTALESCQFCFKGSQFKKHLVIALGDKTYLSVPTFGTLVPGHCIICTVEHQTSLHGTDESEWNEIQRFKNSIRQMYLKQNKDVVFMETVTPYSLRKESHSFLECIPVPIHVGQEAPSYFKKAILESGSEWSDNPKLIDTTGKGIKRSVPSGFPYFYVEFALSGKGFAHIIENENKFSFQFGKEIVSGMLKLPGNAVKSLKSHGEEADRKQMLAFADMYKDFDWTVELG